MKSTIGLGKLFALLGILGLTLLVFITSQTKDVAKLGELAIQSTEESKHVIPQALSAGVPILGVVLIGVGAYTRRKA